jgi:L-rhamnose mutarotase
MERYTFIMALEPGTEAEYERRHDELWPEMLEALQRTGHTNYTLFRHGTTVVGYCECVPDRATTLAAMSAEPVTKRWDESFRGIIAQLPEGGFATELRQIWHIE